MLNYDNIMHGLVCNLILCAVELWLTMITLCTVWYALPPADYILLYRGGMVGKGEWLVGRGDGRGGGGCLRMISYICSEQRYSRASSQLSSIKVYNSSVLRNIQQYQYVDLSSIIGYTSAISKYNTYLLNSITIIGYTLPVS